MIAQRVDKVSQSLSSLTSARRLCHVANLASLKTNALVRHLWTGLCFHWNKERVESTQWSLLLWCEKFRFCPRFLSVELMSKWNRDDYIVSHKFVWSTRHGRISLSTISFSLISAVFSVVPAAGHHLVSCLWLWAQRSQKWKVCVIFQHQLGPISNDFLLCVWCVCSILTPRQFILILLSFTTRCVMFCVFNFTFPIISIVTCVQIISDQPIWRLWIAHWTCPYLMLHFRFWKSVIYLYRWLVN